MKEFKMEEIKRMQQLAGLLNEIKVNNPILKELKDELIDVINSYREDEGGDDKTYDSVIDQINQAGNKDQLLSIMSLFLSDEELAKEYIQGYSISEDVSGFNIGQTKTSDGHKTTVTDVDDTTQSVTWSVTKELTDKEIWDDLTKLIKKFETIQTKDFHSRPKLIQLLKDLKTIRNKFSRTIPK